MKSACKKFRIGLFGLLMSLAVATERMMTFDEAANGWQI